MLVQVSAHRARDVRLLVLLFARPGLHQLKTAVKHHAGLAARLQGLEL